MEAVSRARLRAEQRRWLRALVTKGAAYPFAFMKPHAKAVVRRKALAWTVSRLERFFPESFRVNRWSDEKLLAKLAFLGQSAPTIDVIEGIFRTLGADRSLAGARRGYHQLLLLERAIARAGATQARETSASAARRLRAARLRGRDAVDAEPLFFILVDRSLVTHYPKVTRRMLAGSKAGAVKVAIYRDAESGTVRAIF
jgi:hypothetical protein